MVDRASPGESIYNMPRTRRIRGRLEIPALERALDGLAARHEVIRTRFAEREGAVVQVVTEHARVPLEVVDLRGVGAETREREAARRAEADGFRPFDLTKDLLLRAVLYRLADDDAVLLVATHHIVSDGWSAGILFRDLFELYLAEVEERAPVLPDLPIQFGDYASWQRETLAGPRLEELRSYWGRQLAGPLPSLDLPTDRPRTSSVGNAGAAVSVAIAPEVAARMRAMAGAHSASTYMVVLAAVQTMLARLCGSNDVIVGSPVAGREEADLDGLMGFFANTVALRTRFAPGVSFGSLLDQVRQTCLDGFDHQDMPLEPMLEELKREGHLSDPSLFRVVLTMLDTTPQGREYPGFSTAPFGLGRDNTKFDLTFFLQDKGDSIRLALFYRTDLFNPDTARRILDVLTAVLDGGTRAPDRAVVDLPLVGADDTRRLREWQGPLAPPEPDLVVRLIGERAAATPAATAIQAGESAVTYGDLWAESDTLARRLIAAGVGRGDRIGICLDRDVTLLVAVLGVWRAGAAYVPLLPDLPPARLAQLVTESAARAVVTSSIYRDRMPAGIAVLDVRTGDGAPAAEALPGLAPNDLAYVLFTSGSTGVPKGVAVTHGNLAHYVRGVSHRLGLALDGSTPWSGASVSTLAADLGHTAVFPILAAGGVLHLIPGDVAMEPARWNGYLTGRPIDLLKITPSHLRALIADASGQALAAVLPRRWLVLGGEACPWPLVRAIQDARPGCRILNHYGPTETTVGVCTFAPDEVDLGDATPASVPIGRPLPNMRADILDPQGQLVPVGFPGELWIGGPQVAAGYLAQPALTRERFVERDGIRWYRTGDRVRRLATGDIEFLGRLDAQIKIRGHRVEPEEIETFLSRIPGVRQAAVALNDDRLVAFVVADHGTDEAWTAAARAGLPDHMVPSAWVRLDQLPLNANGKLDRRSLPSIEANRSGPASGAAPRNPTEETLVQIWQEVLKRPSVGIDDNFFDLGGHSLTAIRILGRVSKSFGVRLPLKALFDAPTIAGFGELVAPRSPTEQALGDIWREVLKKERVGLHENFFDLGGHSLLAIRLLGRISKGLGVRLALRDLFEAPTVAQLAEVIDLTRQLAAVESLTGPGQQA